jgi:hypothetical protein
MTAGLKGAIPVINRPARVLCISLILMLAPAANGAPLVSGELGLAYDSNLNNGYGYGGSYERSDQAAQLAAGLRQRWRASDSVALDAGLRAHGEIYERYSALSNYGASVSGRMLYRPGRALLSPTWEAGLSAGYADYDSDIRDRAVFRLHVALRQPLTTRIHGRLQLGAQRDRARSDVFDADVVGLSGELDWLLTEHLLVYFSQHWQRGDIVSTAMPGSGPPVYAASAADEAFSAGEVAYRVDGRTWVTGLGANQRLSQHWSADLLFRYADASANYGSGYRRLQGYFTVLMRY